MSRATKSYRTVSYDLRPAKQVERRMMLDAFGRLMNRGLPLRDYQYTSLGSIYYYDLLLMYKLVGLKKFVTVEHDRDITRRMLFNKPFDHIEVRMEPVGDVIPDLRRDLSHILWLDYDACLVRSMLEDTTAAAYQMSPGSIILVTVDSEPPRRLTDPARRLTDPAARQTYFEEEAGDFLPFDFDLEWCAGSRLPETNLRILANAVESGVASRPGLAFLPMFKFVYADSHKMVTLGGMIGSDQEEETLNACDWDGAAYLRRDVGEPAYTIKVPSLTRKERLFLDRHMPCADAWVPEEFELDAEEVRAYREIHRFYPHYGEFIA